MQSEMQNEDTEQENEADRFIDSLQDPKSLDRKYGQGASVEAEDDVGKEMEQAISEIIDHKKPTLARRVSRCPLAKNGQCHEFKNGSCIKCHIPESFYSPHSQGSQLSLEPSPKSLISEIVPE